MPIPIRLRAPSRPSRLDRLVVRGAQSAQARSNITHDEIIKRQPLSRPKRIPLAAVAGFVVEGPGWAPTPSLLWTEGGRTRKFPLPMYRAEDGTLLREIAPALAETLARLRCSRPRASGNSSALTTLNFLGLPASCFTSWIAPKIFASLFIIINGLPAFQA